MRLPDLAGPSWRIIRQRVARAVVIFAIDGSGSVHGAAGTDPEGARNAACLSVLDLMRRHGGGRAGVVHWGRPRRQTWPWRPCRYAKDGWSGC